MVVATFLLCPKNKRQKSINDFWPCILEIAWAVRRRYAIIMLLAAFLGKTSCNRIVTRSYKCASTERQRSVNDFRPCIMENPSIVR